MAILAQLIDDVVTNRFEIPASGLSIGRAPSNSVQIDEEAVSGQHAVILVETDRFFSRRKQYILEDKNSTNGTYVNGKRIHGRVQLNHNDIIRMAWTEFKFIDEQDAVLDKTVHMVSDI